jgi:hypothetical protein
MNAFHMNDFLVVMKILCERLDKRSRHFENGHRMSSATSTSSFPPTTQPLVSDFSRDIRQVATQLRTSLSSLITSVGLDPQDPQALTRRWGVNKTLSWKITKVIQTDDAFLALQQVPGREGMDILLKKGEAAGVQPYFVQATKAAVDRFEQLIETHCGDRTTFEMMGSDVTPVGRQQREEQHRKQLFQGASYVWGVQTRMYFNLRVLAPSATPGTLDIVSVAGLLDFRRLRENVRWTMFRSSIFNDKGSPGPFPSHEPIDPNAKSVPLMLDFCSNPASTLSVVYDGDIGTAVLAPGQVGNAGVMSYLSGTISRRLPGVRSEQDQVGMLPAVCNTPAEMLLYDIYVHESLTDALPPKPLLIRMPGSVPPKLSEFDQFLLPLFEPLLDMGPATTAPFTPEVPRYGEIINTVFNRTGWSPARFHGFRMKMAYPPVMAALVMQYPLPEA